MNIGRILSIITVLLFSFAWQANSCCAYSGGSGTDDDPYQIANVGDLLALAADTDNYDKSFILTGDIDLDPNLPGRRVFASAVIAPGFTPYTFAGVFDGNDHRIINLTINGSDNSFFGLFGFVLGADFKNIRLENVRVNAGNNSDQIGGLVGYCSNTYISGCSVTGVVEAGNGSGSLGGLAGYCESTNISDCNNFCDITVGASSDYFVAYIGGLVGYFSGIVSECNSTGTITGADAVQYFGGLVGYADGDINNSCASGNIDTGASAIYIGGLAGYSAGTVSDCNSAGTVTGSDYAQYFGGLVGYSDGNINNSYAAGDIFTGDSALYLGGLAGYSPGIISDCNSAGAIICGDSAQYIGGLAGYSAGDVNNSCAAGNISADDSAQFIGGLIGYSSGTVSECNSAGSVRSGDSVQSFGGLVGYSDSDINNSCTSGNISAGESAQYVGGLVGYHSSGGIYRCFSTGDITDGNNAQNVGGLVGIAIGNISECFSTSAVTSRAGAFYLGGLAGVAYNGVSDCFSVGAVTGGDSSTSLGGLVGYNYGAVHNCFSVGNVSGGTAPNSGGLIGTNNGGSINNCYFLNTSGANNNYGTPLTNVQMKLQNSFTGFDFIGETANGPNDIWAICESLNYPKLAWAFDGNCPLIVSKCTVTAGSKPNTDSISISGIVGISPYDFNDGNAIEVTISSEDMYSFVKVFDVNARTYNKGKYSSSVIEAGTKKSFAFDFKTHKFTFAVSKANLTKLSCPITFDIKIGGKTNTATIAESIVNGTKPIPIKLLLGVRDSLGIYKSTVKRGTKPSTGLLSVSGGISVQDVNDVNMVNSGMVVTLASSTYAIPSSRFKAGKGKSFSCSKVSLSGGNGIAAATFNFDKCTFTLTIKNTTIPADHGLVDFNVVFTGYAGPVQQINLP